MAAAAHLACCTHASMSFDLSQLMQAAKGRLSSSPAPRELDQAKAGGCPLHIHDLEGSAHAHLSPR